MESIPGRLKGTFCRAAGIPTTPTRLMAATIRAAKMFSDLIETIQYPSCDCADFSCIRPAAYPEEIPRDELAAIYQSSSDHQLLDQLSECRGCGLANLNPRVRSSIIMAGYEAAEDPTFFRQNPLRIRTFSRYIEMIDQRLRLRERGKLDVLDVSCAARQLQHDC